MRYPIMLITLLAACLTREMSAQQYKAPVNYQLKKAADYAAYEQTLIQTVHWLIHTPLEWNMKTRLDAEKFLLAWISGSPLVSTFISPVIDPIINEKNKPYKHELLSVFLGGMTVFQLQHPGISDQDTIQLAGLDSLLACYQYNIPLLYRDKALRQYIRLARKGKLIQWIDEHQQ